MMNTADFTQIPTLVRTVSPLVHCITNYVTVNDVANMVLACGASPIMADDRAEAAEITAICSATYINIGTLNSRTVESMLCAGRKANELHHPLVLDPVGAGASAFRTDTVRTLLRELRFTVIKGNSSEIRTIAQGTGTTKGVDADMADAVTEDNLDASAAFARNLAGRTGAVIVMTGAIDIIACADSSYVCRNGHPMLKSITGSGCMLGAVTAAFCGAVNADIPAFSPVEAAAAAVCAFGLCGERAHERSSGAGTGSFRAQLIDEMSLLTGEKLSGGARIEKR